MAERGRRRSIRQMSLRSWCLLVDFLVENRDVSAFDLWRRRINLSTWHLSLSLSLCFFLVFLLPSVHGVYMLSIWPTPLLVCIELDHGRLWWRPVAMAAGSLVKITQAAPNWGSAFIGSHPLAARVARLPPCRPISNVNRLFVFLPVPEHFSSFHFGVCNHFFKDLFFWPLPVICLAAN